MITLALTNYNRYEMLLESFAQVIDDDRITEIVISDDCSRRDISEKIAWHFLANKKVKLFYNEKNVGMSMNKKLAVERSTNEWVILFDSDNIIDPTYIDALEQILLRDDTIYCPEFARPNFDYTIYSRYFYHAKNIKQFIQEPMFNCCMNTANYVVNREKYLQVYKEDKRIKGTDTIHFNKLWLEAGYKFFVVPNMQYEHKVHDGSEFIKHMDYNMKMAEKIKQQIAVM